MILGLWKRIKPFCIQKYHFKTSVIKEAFFFLFFLKNTCFMISAQASFTSIIWMMPFPKSTLLSGHSLILIGNGHSQAVARDKRNIKETSGENFMNDMNFNQSTPPKIINGIIQQHIIDRSRYAN